ncbi:MAG: hypothetical protein KGY70_18295 [Bacteroidales bacterium]|nr:hypothetical protein [Bacteroidales bacterium]
MTKYISPTPKELKVSKEAEGWFERIYKGLFLTIRTKKIYLEALSADPDDPYSDDAVIWLSDGTGSGDSGDLMIKSTNSGGTTSTGTLFNHT